jgi:hypothetical protein
MFVPTSCRGLDMCSVSSDEIILFALLILMELFGLFIFQFVAIGGIVHHKSKSINQIGMDVFLLTYICLLYRRPLPSL